MRWTRFPGAALVSAFSDAFHSHLSMLDARRSVTRLDVRPFFHEPVDCSIVAIELYPSSDRDNNDRLDVSLASLCSMNMAMLRGYRLA